MTINIFKDNTYFASNSRITDEISLLFVNINFHFQVRFHEQTVVAHTVTKYIIGYVTNMVKWIEI